MPDIRPDEDGWVIPEWLSPSCIDALVLILDEAIRCADAPAHTLAAKAVLHHAASLYHAAPPGQIPTIKREGIVLISLLEVLLCCYTDFSRALQPGQFVAAFVDLRHYLAGNKVEGVGGPRGTIRRTRKGI